jgi:hypothetical protein
MALFNQSTPLSQFADVPDLLPYATTLTKRNGQGTGIKKALDWLLPAAGAIVGTVIAPGVGTQIGASLGASATSAMNRNERKKAAALGADDALQNIDNSMGSTLMAGSMVGLASSFVPKIPGLAPGATPAPLQSVNPTADTSGALGEGAMQATGMVDYRTMLNGFQDSLQQADQATMSPAVKKRTPYRGLSFFAAGGLASPDDVDSESRPPKKNYWSEMVRRNREAAAAAKLPANNIPAGTSPIEAGADFTRDWAGRRAEQGYMGMKPEDATGIETPVASTTESMNHNPLVLLNKVVTGTMDQETMGYYNKFTGNAYISTDLPKKEQYSTAVHESTHDWQREVIGNNGIFGVSLNDNPISRSYSNIETELKRSGKAGDPYYSDPQEVHARVMESRAALGLKPGEPVNQQHLDRLKRANPAVYGDLSTVLDEQGIINVMNKTVYNDTAPTDDGLFRAADGGLPTPEPLAIHGLSLNSPRDRRRQARLLEEPTLRVNDEMFQLGLDQKYGKDSLMTDARLSQKQNDILGSNTTDVVLPGNVLAAQAGADYTRNWMEQRGYGDQTWKVRDPTVMPDAKFNNAFNIGWDGVYNKESDHAYIRESANLDKIQTNALHESTHDAQSALADMPEMQQTRDLLNSRNRYDTPEEAQVAIGADRANYLGQWDEKHARMMEMRGVINQDPNKRFNRLGWMIKTLFHKPEAFKQLKEVMSRKDIFQSLNDTFKEGGKAGTDYRRYLADDPTEDLLMIDKKTGKLFGAMRYGERIYDQTATDTIDKAVKKLRLEPTKEGFAWLGKFIHDETLTHKDHAEKFADGGKATPKKPTIADIQRELKAAGLYDGPLDGKASEALRPAIAKWNKRPGLDKARRIVSIDGDDGQMSALEYRGSDNPDDEPLNTVYDDDASAEFTYEKETKKPAPIVKPQSALTPASLVTPPAATAPDPVSPTLSPAAAPKPQTADTARYNWLNGGNLLNAARIVGGVVAANTPYPDDVDTSKLDMLARESEGRREDGLSPNARRFALDNLADNRSTAYEALRRNAGGGGSSGAVLAGIGQIGQTEVAGDVALGQADEQQRMINRQDYRGLLGAQMDIANQRFQRRFDAVQATRQAGLNLIPQALQGISDDHQYWKQYESPDSVYQKYMTSQTELARQQAEAAKRIYTGNARQFLNAPSVITPTSLSAGIAPTATGLLPGPVTTPPVAPTVMDYRQMFNPIPAFTPPIIPYRRNG